MVDPIPHGGTHCLAKSTGALNLYPDSDHPGVFGTLAMLKAMGIGVDADVAVHAVIDENVLACPETSDKDEATILVEALGDHYVNTYTDVAYSRNGAKDFHSHIPCVASSANGEEADRALRCPGRCSPKTDLNKGPTPNGCEHLSCGALCY